uniref:Peptidase M12B domain-containing protein n=1 Tax=Lygus hesperus TaxID=30085 RepID=A0A0K8T167_LYGHE
MRSAGTKAVACATTSGLVAVLVVALYVSSVLIRRDNEDAAQLHNNNINNIINNTDGTTTSAPLASEEFVKPIKKWPPPIHHQDVIYPDEKLLKDDHHSGHFRERLAQIWDPHPEYEFTGFGRSFHLQLSQSKAPFVVPNLKVAHVWDNMTRLEETPLTSGGCFYSGRVLGDPASNVFVNLCHGMTGHIRTSNGSYLIEPAEEWVDYRTPIRHILRKLNSGPPPRSNNCHTPEADTAEPEDETIRRSKRSTSQEYYLELMVVADRKMAEYHGKELNTYVLNLMATASHIFTDASIGNMITVTVVGLVIAKEEDFTRRRGWAENKKRGYNLSSSSASEMLSNFCRWQNNTSLYPHDTALLITRENICSNPLHEKCETLGLAEVGRVCTKEFSCAIVKDNGLGTAFTIAHELGHVLNMPHDEDNRCEKYNVDKISHVMARVLDNNTSPWSWSECSRQILTEFLQVRELLAEPTTRRYPTRPPQAELPPWRILRL